MALPQFKLSPLEPLAFFVSWLRPGYVAAVGRVRVRSLPRPRAQPEVVVGEVMRKDIEITGGVERHTFDYGLMNGQLRQLVRALSLEAGDKTSVRNEIDAVAWAIDDVRKLNEATPISVVTLGGGAPPERAECLYGGLQANVVHEDALDTWANVIAVDVVAAHH